MCPGAMNNGCPSKSPQIDGKSYCSQCQIKSDAKNSKPESHARVVRAREKRVEREQHIEMLQPIVALLQTQDIRPFIPALSLTFLRDLNQIVGVDSENSKQGNITADFTYEWHFQRYDNNTKYRSNLSRI